MQPQSHPKAPTIKGQSELFRADCEQVGRVGRSEEGGRGNKGSVTSLKITWLMYSVTVIKSMYVRLCICSQNIGDFAKFACEKTDTARHYCRRVKCWWTQDGSSRWRRQRMKDEEEEWGRKTLFSPLSTATSPSQVMISQEWAETPVESWLSLLIQTDL